VSCYFPLPAYEAKGQVKIGRAPGKASSADLGVPTSPGRTLELPCGQCIGCRLEKGKQWSIRIMHEAQLYDSNLFLTLTYSPENLPASCSLEYSDFQGFMKRLRKEVKGVTATSSGKRPVRFFCAGEYGERFGRPHFHAILFNACFADSVSLCNGTLRSATAERLWQRGNVVIGSVTPASAAYVAGYCMNKVYGRAAADHYEDVVNLQTGEVTARRPEFCTMSLRPGIGSEWYARFGGDLFPKDHAIQDGRAYKVPRYYWRKFQESGDAYEVERVSDGRYERARERPISESSEERRRVRAEVAKARVQLFHTRSL